MKIENDQSLQYSHLLEFAIKVAKSCALKIQQHQKPAIVGYKSSATDPASVADYIGEMTIKNLIQVERPEDGMLGEEGSNKKSTNGLRWVFDPLDGTVNYLYGIPHWAVSIACEKFDNNDWITVIGVVYDIVRNEIFTAIRGNGAFMNDYAISVKDPIPLSDALIATEFSYRAEVRAIQVQILAHLLPKVRDIRSTGSSALDLCWLAAGRWDGFYEEVLSRWDWSAASLIIEEAGGKISTLKKSVVAGTPTIHSDLCSLLYTKK